MATQNEVLQILGDAEDPVTVDQIVEKLKCPRNIARARLSELKSKGLAERDGEAWKSTDAGNTTLEREQQVPTSIADVGGDIASRLNYFGQLAGVSPKKIAAAINMITSGEPYDLAWVQQCFGQVGLTWEEQRVWFNLWRNYVIKSAPPEQAEKAKAVNAPLEPSGQGATTQGLRSPTSGEDWMLIDDEPRFVGKGMGSLTKDEAFSLAMMRAGRPSRAHDGAGNSGLTLPDMITLVDKINEGRHGGSQKAYVVSPTAEGMKVQELDPGQPFVFAPPATNPPPTNPPPAGKTFFVNENNELQEVEPGQPIVLRSPAPAQGPTWVVDNETGVLRKLEPGEPVVIKPPQTGGVIIPLKDKDGNPVYLDSRSIESLTAWEGFNAEQRRKDKMHDTWVNAVSALQENVGKVAGGIERLMAERGAGGNGEETAAAGETGGLIQGQCPACKARVAIPRGTEQFVCKTCRTIVEVTA